MGSVDGAGSSCELYFSTRDNRADRLNLTLNDTRFTLGIDNAYVVVFFFVWKDIIIYYHYITLH